MTVCVALNDDAGKLLADEAFVLQWHRLYDHCPWATPFQSPGFVAAWYQCYRSRYEPVLVAGRSEAGVLTGLLPLAICPDNGEVIVAGGWQAEYQTWICDLDVSQVFPWTAICALRRDVVFAELRFRYLPPGTPIDCFSASDAQPMCRLDSHRRPLLRFGDGEAIAATLRHKSKRNSLNRLKKIGPLEFKRINDPQGSQAILDDIIGCYDFRQAAVHGVAPFRDDCLKRAFHLALMKIPGLLHTTVLKVGDRFAAAHLGICGHDAVHLGILAHNPALAKQSAGTFHALFLAQMLMKEGYPQLDLTPGGDPYKDHLANAWDEVHTLTVFGAAWQARKQDLSRVLGDSARRTLTLGRISPKKAKALMRRVSRIRPISAFRHIATGAGRWLARRREVLIYRHKIEMLPDLDGNNLIRRDALDDLLAFEPVEPRQSRRSFLARALERIENGCHVYTHAESGRLLHYAWQSDRQDTWFLEDVGQEFALPPRSACLFDCYTFPPERGRGLLTTSLRTILSDTSRVSEIDQVFIAVPADSAACRQVVEKLGFAYEVSLFEEVRFGRARHWRQRVE
jgi:CelD/BcsL family acetyltransferase involved in cellulose biosynthesis